MAEFSLRRDFRRIDWKNTLQVNLIRSFFAGALWTAYSAAIIASSNDLTGLAFFLWLLLQLFGFPFSYLAVGVPMALVCGRLCEMGVPFVGWINIVFALCILPGDIPTFFLWKAFPRLVPVERYHLLEFVLILFVLKNDESLAMRPPPLPRAPRRIVNCPYCAGQMLINPPMAGDVVECPHCGSAIELP